ncbi:hypothetical protein [Sphingosinicella microcystinivorans]|jgi:hypothetical protein|uniref:NIPSNAP protein n=1 Tax=Sphingosinicella microcystinivorans TaxID=335406 RepID=A0AAD1D8T8_SPHMI|nr:hypothetical protein [Sphingosinicella microcystinivorans]RKS88195.1 hypothetical protein DFR51_2843 [Sphingosinicella microcystinivorans]BBE36007.1 hypothetical protein SmB9_36650 [Sphingosinicella microcystinivorans]|tara:strand:- start:3878 stop:4318 length:441 start_codon:yes stop_codon:yes gene_type:complete
MTYRKFVSLCVASAFVVASPVAAQDTAKKRENVSYHVMEFVKYKEGKGERAYEIVKKYFDPASVASKTPIPEEYHVQYGDWDDVLVWPMKSGADIEWQYSPDDVAWFAELHKLTGSKEASEKLLEEWSGLIANRKRSIVHRHLPKK